MPAKPNNLERLDLRFRAEPAPTAGRLTLPGGLLLWCLLGIGFGLTCWFVGRHSLTQSLATQLSKANSTAEAMLAVEGLLTIDGAAALEIVGGLEHPNDEIARAAYKTLNSQITRWQELDIEISNERLRSLAERLATLSDQTPPSNLVLASSLASRIFSNCLEQDDPLLASILESCEVVIQRAGLAYQPSATTVAGTSEIDAMTEALNSLIPPRPLPPIEEQFTAPSTFGSNSLSDPDEARASMRLVVSRTQPRASELASSSAGSSISSGKFSDDTTETSFSLNDGSQFEPGSEALASEANSYPQRPIANETLPNMMNRAASLSHMPPPADSKSLNDQPELEGIRALEIEELVRLLASVQPHVVKNASLALRSKGMSDEKLALASELATCSAARRLELISEIARRGDMDPRPWLLWMAEDGQPEVRKLSASLLSSMVDPTVERSLRVLLTRERDPTVEQTIREALLAGASNRR